MSTQKGNASRTRPQKYQNKTKFKNDLHDTSHNIKAINSLQIDNVCARCKSIIEWKIKYKKYKPLKSPSTCVKCHNKNVKRAYHIMCSNCSNEFKVCPKCGEEKELVESNLTAIDIDKILKLPSVKEALKYLPERKRRTFIRQVNNLPNDSISEEQILEKLESLLNDKKSNFDECDDFLNDMDSFRTDSSGSDLDS